MPKHPREADIRVRLRGCRSVMRCLMRAKHMSEELHDFKDGNGPVPAHRHGNGAGWVANSARVEITAYVGTNAQVSGTAWVFGTAQVSDDAWVSGNAWVSDNAWV